MHCWCRVLVLCLQRVMKLVSWTACWRHCSLELLSGEREDHGKQVHKQSKSSSVMSYLIYNAFLFRCTCRIMKLICFSSLSLYISTFQSSHNNRFDCAPLFLFHLLHGLETVVGCGNFRGAKPVAPMFGIPTIEAGGCQGWVFAEGYLREEQLVRVWLWDWKI